jgi:tetratricopeptide (TPR) repeat protein
MNCPACGAETAADHLQCAMCLSPLPRGDTSSFVTSAVTMAADPSQPAPPRAEFPNPAEGPLVVGHEFGPRYRVIRLLGIGGMGAVYHAWDLDLGMAVALKVIRAEYAETEERRIELERRFKQELVLARQVTHKHVIRIHDLGEVEGRKYITMAYVQGEDLARLLRVKGKLSVSEALHFARHLASGLQAAHEVGIVHRDLKPANILIEGDVAIITDFGIARAASHAAEGGGGMAGTLPYMAPEQAQGRPIDQRADIYAVGLIIYEMLAGKRWAEGTTAEEILEHKLEHAAVPPDALRTRMPEALADIVGRCLDPNPEKRYQSATVLLDDLQGLNAEGYPLPKPWVVKLPDRWPIVGGRKVPGGTLAALATLVVALPIVSVIAFLGGASRTPPAAIEPISVLIADFQQVKLKPNAADPVASERPLGDVVEEALGVAMEGASFINTYPRADARAVLQQIAPGAMLDVERARLVAQREGIKIVLGGRIEQVGSAYKVTVDTIDPVPGTIVETTTATANNKDDVLNAVGELASNVRGTLGDTTPETARLSARETFTTGSMEAASVYWRAQELMTSSRYEDAITDFRRATEIDPSFARAYAGWAVAAYSLGRIEEAARLYKTTFALADRMSEREKYRTYGTYYLTVARGYDQAIANYTKLVELYPADRVGHANLAVAYFYALNFAKALEVGQRAMKLYPATALKWRNNVALYALFASDFATAKREAEEVIKRDAGYFRAYMPLAASSVEQSPEYAREAYQRMSRIGLDGAAVASIGLTDLALYQGRDADAIATAQSGLAADSIKRRPDNKAALNILLAEAYLAGGQSGRSYAAARAALDTSRDEHVSLAAARTFIALGRLKEASELAKRLDAGTRGYSRVYARIVQGELALQRGAIAEAVETFQAGQKIGDLWLTRFMLGVAFIHAERYPDALDALETCVKRRGEATAIFFDDLPSARYLAPLPYWLGRAQEATGLRKQAGEQYDKFLRLRPNRPRDPLVVNAQQRLARLQGG